MPEVDEQARLTALRSYQILDTEPEAAFDDLTLLASQICGTPMALITLIDDHRQWFKSERGIGIRETERSVAFCTHAIKQPGRIMEVPDTREDDSSARTPSSPASRTFVSTQAHRWSPPTATRSAPFASWTPNRAG